MAELPVFDGSSYPASGSAENTEPLLIARADLRAISLETPEVSLKLLQVVGKRLRQLVNIIEELSFTIYAVYDRWRGLPRKKTVTTEIAEPRLVAPVLGD